MKASHRVAESGVAEKAGKQAEAQHQHPEIQHRKTPVRGKSGGDCARTFFRAASASGDVQRYKDKVDREDGTENDDEHEAHFAQDVFERRRVAALRPGTTE